MNINNLSLEELGRILDSNDDYNAIYMNDIVDGFTLADGTPAGLGDIQRRYQELLNPTIELEQEYEENVIRENEEFLEGETYANAFERVMGIPYDESKYRVVPNDDAYDDGYDNPISTFNIVERKPVKKEEPEEENVVEKQNQEDEYDLNLITTKDFDSMTMSKEDEFKRIMGFDFDPYKYEIRIDEGVNSFDDGVYEQLQIFEKVPRKQNNISQSIKDVIKEDDTPEKDEEPTLTDEEIEAKNKRKEELEQLIKESHIREQKDKDEGNDDSVAFERSYRQNLLNELYKINKELEKNNAKVQDKNDNNKNNMSPDDLKAEIKKLEDERKKVDDQIPKIDLYAPWQSTYDLMGQVIELSKQIAELKDLLTKAINNENNNVQNKEDKKEVESKEESKSEEVKQEENKDQEENIIVEKKRKTRFRRFKAIKAKIKSWFTKDDKNKDIDVPDDVTKLDIDKDDFEDEVEKIEPPKEETNEDKKQEEQVAQEPIDKKNEIISDEDYKKILGAHRDLLAHNKSISEENKRIQEENDRLGQQIAAMQKQINALMNNDVKKAM